MTIKLHTNKCISCGMCESIAPELFSVKSGIVSLKKDPSTWDENDWNKAKEAAAGCPGEVIEISEK